MLRAADQAEGIRMRRQEGSSKREPKQLVLGKTRTIAVTSGKGGVGKTQISANLAVSLARQGARVLLLDADLGLASLDLVFGVRPRADLLSVMRGERLAKDILIEAAPGVQLLPACPGRYEMANLSAPDRDRLMNMVQEVASGFDAWIIDTGAGIGSNSVAFAEVADEIVLVVTPDPTSLRDAYAMAKVLHRRSSIDRIQLVANQVEHHNQGLEVYQRLNGVVRNFLALDLNYLGAIPKDPAIPSAIASGHPCVLGAPNSPAARAMETLAKSLHAEFKPKSANELC
jgi:flagellar biosynthesis protein FlhG